MGSLAEPAPLAGGGMQLVRTWNAANPWAHMVVVHGLGEHSGRYERTGALFAEAGIAVRSFDLEGFGASTGARADIVSWARYLDQVEEHLIAVPEPRVLLGHSLGGLIAAEYAVSERLLPQALVLSAPGLGGGKAWQRALAPMVGKLLPTLRLPTLVKGEQLSRDPAVGEAYFADSLVDTKATARFGAEVFAAQDRTLAALARLQTPTFVTHGGSDTLVPPTASLPLAELASVERKLYPTLRHEMFNEPEGPEVIADVVAWLRRTLQ